MRVAEMRLKRSKIFCWIPFPLHAANAIRRTLTQVQRFGNFDAIYMLGLLYLRGYSSDTEVQ